MKTVVCMSTKHVSLHAFMHSAVGMVDGCGYDGQQKWAICDTCRVYHSILSISKPVFTEFDRFVAYNPVRCLDLQIWQFLFLRK